MADFLYTYWLAQGDSFILGLRIVGAVLAVPFTIFTIIGLASSVEKSHYIVTAVAAVIAAIGFSMLLISFVFPSPTKMEMAKLVRSGELSIVEFRNEISVDPERSKTNENNP